MSLALPKPRRALWIVLIAMTVLGILGAFLSTWVNGGHVLFDLLACDPRHALTQPWRLLTSGLLTSTEQWSHLIFSLLGLYFLSPPLEERWGSWRFARFLALAVVVGNLTVLGVSHLVPAAASDPRFHPALLFGPMAAITAIAVAWSREFANSTVNLFFFLPIRGKVLLWITLGFCVLTSSTLRLPEAWWLRSAESSRGCSSAARHRRRGPHGSSSGWPCCAASRPP